MPYKIPVRDLKPGDRYRSALYLDFGVRLLLPDQSIDGVLAKVLQESPFDTVLLINPGEQPPPLHSTPGWRPVLTASLHAGTPNGQDLFDEGGRLAFAADAPVTERRLLALRRRGGDTLYERADALGGPTAELLKTLARSVNETLGEAPANPMLATPPARPLAETWSVPSPSDRSRRDIEHIQAEHVRDLEQVHDLFQGVVAGDDLDLARALEIVESALTRLERDRHVCVLVGQRDLHSDYLVDHALSVTLLALAAAAHLPLPRGNLVELGLAALLMDAGMLRVPQAIRNKPSALNEAELREVRKHPASSVELLQAEGGAGLNVYFGVYQSHERIDGRGYPLGLSDERIHPYAKLLAVVDTYEAMISTRPYRHAIAPSRAMEHVLKMVSAGLQDGPSTRALLAAVSVHPIGTWMRLNSGFVARVVGPSAGDVTRPKVAVLRDPSGSALPSPLYLDLSRNETTRVASLVEDEGLSAVLAAGFHAEPLAAPAAAATVAAPATPRPEVSSSGRTRVPKQLLSWSASFSGDMAEFALIDVIQLVDLSQKSGVLSISLPGSTGRIHFRDGEMLCASYDGLADEEAIYAMVRRRDGSFSFQQRQVDRPKTIRSNNNAILLEACRREDER